MDSVNEKFLLQPVPLSIMQRYSLKRTVGKVAGLGGMGILGVLIGGVALVPIADTFLESARAGVLAAKGLLIY